MFSLKVHKPIDLLYDSMATDTIGFATVKTLGKQLLMSSDY